MRRRARAVLGWSVALLGRVRAGVAVRAMAVLALAPWVALVVGAALTPMPKELAGGAREYAPSTRIVDRQGRTVVEVRADDGTRARWVPLDEVGERVQRAMIAAEDKRFAHHVGVDPLAMARALFQLVAERRVVSGASTLTQQLARTLVPRRRSLAGKLAEMALALRIEASLGKRAILEQYLNRAAFGPGLRGIEAASRQYFDKPTRDLSLAEAAALAGMPRGPSLYDPRRGAERLRARRDRVLDRMAAMGAATADEVARAKAEPITLAPGGAGLGAPHFVRAVLGGAVDPAAGALRGRAREIETTIDRDLQREAEAMARRAVRALAPRGVSAASVVVIENDSGEILAYVGAPDIEDAARLGHNDGVLALRQPGSALKPFVYELAVERLGFGAATLLPDVETHFTDGAGGDYDPHNYDGRFHGPVLLREALASSYNVPAAFTASRLGPDRVLARLQELGLGSLDRDPEHYGVAIALGDGEVRLLDVANAYATLARGGLWRPVRAVRAARDAAGAPLPLAAAETRRVLDEGASRLVADVLADPHARIASFGQDSVLELPFAAAAKTGTSKGFRDNVAAGFTRDVTVAVWVGNFDGSPMHGVSGVSGAGPLFRDVMLAAARRAGAGAVPPGPGPRIAAGEPGFEEAEICSLSGARPTAACPHRRREVFLSGHAPRAPCSMHERVRVDRRTGLLAGPACSDDVVDEAVLESYPAALQGWARRAGRPVVPDAFSPFCPGPERDQERARGGLRVAFPPDGSRFSIDPSARARQALRIRADVPAGARGVRVVIDGVPRPLRAPFAIEWPLTAGEHHVKIEADDLAPSETVDFGVD